MILDEILARTRADLAERKKAVPLSTLSPARAAKRYGPTRSLRRALRSPGNIACIAEFKRKSPSAGWINEKASTRSPPFAPTRRAGPARCRC